MTASQTQIALLPPAVRVRPRVQVGLAIALGILALVAVAAVGGSLVTPYEPQQRDLQVGLATPGSGHVLGTDDLGRDVLSRTIAGTRTAVVGPLLIALGAMLIGNVLGLIAGYYGGRIDSTIMRWADLMFATPGLLVAIVLVGVLGGGYWLAVGLLVILFAPYDARLVRGAALEQRARPYIEAVRAQGTPAWRVITVELWPNILPIVVANSFVTFAFALAALASLSFLGLGVDPGTADWGRMLAESRTLLFENPAAALAPGVMIVVTAASLNLVGDWLYERIAERGTAR